MHTAHELSNQAFEVPTTDPPRRDSARCGKLESLSLRLRGNPYFPPAFPKALHERFKKQNVRRVLEVYPHP